MLLNADNQLGEQQQGANATENEVDGARITKPAAAASVTAERAAN